jgi:hypothetical protein
MSEPSGQDFFEQVRDALLTVVASEHADFGGYAHGGGVKVTYGSGERTKEHYEAQLVRGARAGSIELEVGFHSEHAKAERNDAVIATLLVHEKRWRRALGREPVVGPFLGNDRWRRISETWDTFDFRDPECAFEVADRLAEYVAAFEPLLDR